MKIPPSNPLTTRPNPEPNRGVTKRGQASTDAARFDDADEPVEGAAATERDFASVFDEVVSRGERREDEAHEEGDRRVSRETERAGREGEARLREEREGGSNNAGTEGRGGGGFEGRAALREVTPAADATSARAILHVADLERIVSAVRAQVVDGGRHVVTIELRRSVLEGLKVRLSTDGGRAVTAEFVAASEHVRSQIEARAGELAGLLRGRGVNLAALRTGVETGAGATGGEDPSREELSQTVRRARAASNEPSAVTRADEAPEEFDGGAANTYRA
jgi:hypothetical protein